MLEVKKTEKNTYERKKHKQRKNIGMIFKQDPKTLLEEIKDKESFKKWLAASGLENSKKFNLEEYMSVNDIGDGENEAEDLKAFAEMMNWNGFCICGEPIYDDVDSEDGEDDYHRVCEECGKVCDKGSASWGRNNGKYITKPGTVAMYNWVCKEHTQEE